MLGSQFIGWLLNRFVSVGRGTEEDANIVRGFRSKIPEITVSVFFHLSCFLHAAATLSELLNIGFEY